MAFCRFEDIKIWQMGRELVQVIYEVARCGDFARDRGLKDQIQRAAVSICSNIAEGYARRGNKEFVKFLWIAKGSAAEVQSQLYHAKDLKYVTEEEFQKFYDKANLIQVTIYKLIESLSSDISRQKV